ncbi:phosphotransferase, partial [Candidatus Roizmanbacteria bacterium]|nr:phosphotransferase [Candidatus Roizmanbacteria bacterium]
YNTYLIDDTKKAVDFDYMILECLRGENQHKEWPLDVKRDKKLCEETGYYLAKIHSVKTKGFGFFQNSIAKEKKLLVGYHNKWKKHIYASFTNNLDYLIKNKIILPADRKKIESIYLGRESLLKYDDPRLIHNDIADWNQLCQGNHVTAILDWDECYSGDPVVDFSAWSVFFPYKRMEYLKQGYLKVSPLPEGFEEKLHFYRIRYIVSKATLRTKRLLGNPSKQVQDMLDYALKILREEFMWYGI